MKIMYNLLMKLLVQVDYAKYKNMEHILKYKYEKGKRLVFPEHQFVSNWLFTEDSEDEAKLALYVAKIAEKNGMSINDVYAVFPFILRMLKSKDIWAGNERTE